MKALPLFLLPSTAWLSLAWAGTSLAAGASPDLVNPPLRSIAPIPQELAQTPALPSTIANAVISTHSRNVNQPTNRFTIIGSTARNWPDGCLGLAEPGEFCAQVLVPGWQVTLTDGQQTWVYRTDSAGSSIRLESGVFRPTPTIPTPSAPTPSAPSRPNPSPPSTNTGWQAQLRWSRINDRQEPGLVFQLDVLQKPTTLYANAVYQFYVRKTGESRWEHLYTNMGARLIPNNAAPFTLPLELIRFDDLRDKLGASYNWSRAQIRAVVSLRYDLSKDPAQRDLQLRFEHQGDYQDIATITWDDLVINQDGSVEVPGYQPNPPITVPNPVIPPVAPPTQVPQPIVPPSNPSLLFPPPPPGSPFEQNLPTISPSTPNLPEIPSSLTVPVFPPLGNP